jgi:hypothetical protein
MRRPREAAATSRVAGRYLGRGAADSGSAPRQGRHTEAEEAGVQGLRRDRHVHCSIGSNAPGANGEEQVAGLKYRYNFRPEGNWFSWFQANQACRLSGKRLLRNDEWHPAAQGTPDPGTDNQTTDCNVGIGGLGEHAVNTGSRSSCQSSWGVFDMVHRLPLCPPSLPGFWRLACLTLGSPRGRGHSPRPRGAVTQLRRRPRTIRA